MDPHPFNLGLLGKYPGRRNWGFARVEGCSGVRVLEPVPLVPREAGPLGFGLGYGKPNAIIVSDTHLCIELMGL